MKKWMKRLSALGCSLALALALALPARSAVSDVYLLAVNDQFYDVYLPENVNGVIYIPYTAFDKNATGVDLGVYYGISPERGMTLSLYAMGKTLIFTVKMGVCVDGEGNTMSFRAVIRNEIPYVPAKAVCDFFGLHYFYYETEDRGSLVRVTSDSAVLSDAVFLSSAKGSMSYRYNNIIKSQEPQPTPTPAQTPTPTPAATQTPAPVVSAPPESKEGVTVYLAVDASQAQADLTALFPEGVHALFLFTVDSLPGHASQVRKAVAAGHSVGLIVEGDLEDCLDQLARGNELLTHIARVRTRVVSAPAEVAGDLQAQGWSCWQANVAGSTASTLLERLDRLGTRRTVVGRVELPAAVSVVSRVVNQVVEDGYTLRQPLETEL